MKKLKLTVSQLGDILSIVSFSLLSFLLVRNIYFAVASFVLSGILVVFLLIQANKIKSTVQEKLSAYTFFSAFLKNISCTENVKLSYENSVRYLNGYQNTVPFEELEPTSIRLFRYDCLFSFILEKYKANEALLLFYVPVIDELKQVRSYLDERLKHIEKQKNEMTIFLLLFALLLSLFLFFAPVDGNIFSTLGYLIPSSILITISLPINYFIYVLRLKGEDSHA